MFYIVLLLGVYFVIKFGQTLSKGIRYESNMPE